jgi:NADH-quinone oxidoreductase subunit L
MLELLWLVLAFPAAGFLILTAFGASLPKRAVPLVGVGSVGLSAASALAVAAAFLTSPPPGGVFVEHLWTWWRVAGFSPSVGLSLDALSLVMILVVTGVGFLIHLYSAEFMEEDGAYPRFFAYMNLFVTAMLALVLADNLVFLLLGWEGVGLCSYLLIGFWYTDPANGHAARKAFVVTRIGDVALTVGLFFLFSRLGTLNIRELMARASEAWPVGSATALAAALLLLGGAMGKSAQLPLQTWLPDAMAGPTPVSALIHAATMVTAGVYLIARTHALFELAPTAMRVVAAVGMATLVMAGFAALGQRDLKRILAYSTISQIGYMFLGLGVGAWAGAIFHFMTHAFFKALLFLGAGVIIHCLYHEHDIYRMRGLRRQLPTTFWTFLAASGALAGFPLITSGFYSKDLILTQAFTSPYGTWWLWAGGLLGVLLTGLYIFRAVFVAFFGEPQRELERRPGLRLRVPLVVLAVLSIGAGFIETPDILGGIHVLSDFLGSVLPAMPGHPAPATEIGLETAAGVASLLGIGLAAALFLGRRGLVDRLTATALGGGVRRLWAAGWGFDWLYDLLFARPYAWLAHINRNDVVDQAVLGIRTLSTSLNRALSRTQTGRLRWYAAGMAAGAAVVLLIVVLA